jgi:heme exporter protein CcmD
MTEVPHLGFIVAAYGVTAFVVLAMVGAILWDYRSLTAKLSRLEEKR